ncbi:hypothetical protein AAFF_G00273510 [Aldrovandia affinis]|uniref:Uncharacterized protein n=1 Tax=Aldrovandia affinis TaxID=143900 RepID=A0AAD7SRH4_9TELE|nr:hypothetical protein AAFF_G00273510 [Aldrovandia affinis]
MKIIFMVVIEVQMFSLQLDEGLQIYGGLPLQGKKSQPFVLRNVFLLKGTDCRGTLRDRGPVRPLISYAGTWGCLPGEPEERDGAQRGCTIKGCFSPLGVSYAPPSQGG